MKEYLKLGLGIFGKLFILGIMCLFLSVSFSVLASAAFTQNIGYVAYGAKGDEAPTELYTHYLKDGEDTKLAEYEKEGYVITKKGIRSELAGAGKTVFYVLTQASCYFMLCAFLYPKLWERGTRDSNLVQFKHCREDKLKGLKAGIIAVIPATVFTLFLAVTSSGISKNFPIVIYKFLQAFNFNVIDAIVGKAGAFGELSAIKLIALILLQTIVPAVTFVSYYLGYKNISLSEKLVYKKKKS